MGTTKNLGKRDDEQQKWFMKEDLQDLAKIGSNFLKKTMVSGMDVIKEVKENLPKEATQILNKGKEELLRGLSQETAKSLISYSLDKFFKLASEYRLEFSFRIRKNEESSVKNTKINKTRSNN